MLKFCYLCIFNQIPRTALGWAQLSTAYQRIFLFSSNQNWAEIENFHPTPHIERKLPRHMCATRIFPPNEQKKDVNAQILLSVHFHPKSEYNSLQIKTEQKLRIFILLHPLRENYRVTSSPRLSTSRFSRLRTTDVPLKSRAKFLIGFIFLFKI